jgi:nitroreductase
LDNMANILCQNIPGALARHQTSSPINPAFCLLWGGIHVDALEAIHKRRSVRAYRSDPVPSGTLERLVDAAILAPSAVNSQPWHFTIIRNQALLDRISHAAKSHALRTIPGDGLMREQLKDAKFQIFYHAPALILISSAGGGDWASEDSALAAENLMLAACAEGLGTCWIGFAQRWLETEEGKSTAGLPAGYLPVAPIIVGVPSGPVAAVPRQAAEIHWLD